MNLLIKNKIYELINQNKIYELFLVAQGHQMGYKMTEKKFQDSIQASSMRKSRLGNRGCSESSLKFSGYGASVLFWVKQRPSE